VLALTDYKDSQEDPVHTAQAESLDQWFSSAATEIFMPLF